MLRDGLEDVDFLYTLRSLASLTGDSRPREGVAEVPHEFTSDVTHYTWDPRHRAAPPGGGRDDERSRPADGQHGFRREFAHSVECLSWTNARPCRCRANINERIPEIGATLAGGGSGASGRPKRPRRATSPRSQAPAGRSGSIALAKPGEPRLPRGEPAGVHFRWAASQGTVWLNGGGRPGELADLQQHQIGNRRGRTFSRCASRSGKPPIIRVLQATVGRPKGIADIRLSASTGCDMSLRTGAASICNSRLQPLCARREARPLCAIFTLR